MNILVTNDDGILAPGLASLVEVLGALGTVEVVAPEAPQSGAGHAVTFMDPLVCERVWMQDRFAGWSVAGSPADCVKLAVGELCRSRPDLVVSGINAGANQGVDVIYSGTVAAAVEAAFCGIPSMAISLEGRGTFEFGRAAPQVRRVVERAIEIGLVAGRVLNVNIPCPNRVESRGIKVVRQCTQPWRDSFERRTDPRGRSYFWLTEGGDRLGATDPDTDIAALRDGFVTVTPLQHDLTDYGQLEGLSRLWTN